MKGISPLRGNILLVEDDELSSELLDKYLSSHGYAVTVLGDGEQLENAVKNQRIDAILLDIILPGQDGLYWLEWLKIGYPHIPVLLCSRRTGAEDRVIGLSKGAIDYIVKPFHPKEILFRLNNVLGKPQNHVFPIGDLDFDPQRALLIPRTDNPQKHPIGLSTQEVSLLQLLFQQPGITVTRDSIAEWLHGNGHDPKRRNLDMLITRLRKKLGDSNTMPKYLHTVWGRGYRFTPEG